MQEIVPNKNKKSRQCSDLNTMQNTNKTVNMKYKQHKQCDAKTNKAQQTGHMR